MKYRFIDETESQPPVGLLPLLEVPTGSARENLGSGSVQAYLPVRRQKSRGKLTTYRGAGFWLNPGTG